MYTCSVVKKKLQCDFKKKGGRHTSCQHECRLWQDLKQETFNQPPEARREAYSLRQETILFTPLPQTSGP